MIRKKKSILNDKKRPENDFRSSNITRDGEIRRNCHPRREKHAHLGRFEGYYVSRMK